MKNFAFIRQNRFRNKINFIYYVMTGHSKQQQIKFLHKHGRLCAAMICLALTVPFNGLRAQVDTSNTSLPPQDTVQTNPNIPIFSTNGGDAESDADQQDMSSLLQSSRDVFTQFASFQFSAGYYRMRGYSSENQQVMINGVNVNNLETGYSSWSSWGGLNDVTRYVENRVGVTGSRYGFSGPGGYTNIDSRASSFKKGTNVSYASANRIFRHRFMATYSTGLMKNGWALTASASNRVGNQVYVPGTYFNGSSYYLSIDKKLKDKHLFSFTGFVAPIEQGRSTYQRSETYQLAGSNYYNNLWGYQNGKVRNASVSRTRRPMMMLSYINNLSEASRITTSLYYTFGKNSISSIGFNDATNPNPEFYKYLPSTYYEKGDTITGNYFTNKWLTDVNSRQVDWDRMIALNRANIYALPSQLGQTIITNETRARYIVENRVENLSNVGINSVYNTRIKDLFLSAGLNANLYKNRKYKEVEDLLGATYWLDYDRFALGQGVDANVQQNDISNPDRKVYQGEKFGYDYAINVNRAEGWAQAEQSFKKVDLFASVSLSSYSVWREGFVANGKFPTSSKGTSAKLNLINYGAKGGITYKINGRHSLTANASYLTRPPEANNIFIGQQVRNDLVSGVGSEKVLAGDLNYIIKYPGFKLRLTGYYTQINNQVWVRSYYNDIYNTFVNLIMKGVNQSHQGIEFSLEKTLFTSHVIQTAFGLGQFVYTNRPTLDAWQYNSSAAVFTDRTVYLKNYRVGGSPQLVYGIGYKYNAKKFWFAAVNFNFFDQIYVEPNPDRRTLEAVDKYLSNETTSFSKITAQEKLPSYFTLNANGGKSFRLAHGKYYLRLNVSVNNLLNNKTNIIGGFEQLRWDPAYLDRFDNKYVYMLGTTYMASVNFSF
ncbi:MAG: hypothetical protein IT236_14285 [Bacteroidia bacterium]|nr:hypothetical protein [Bacteroidia bacterium]